MIYLVAFLVALNQFRPLLGEKGLLPVRLFLPEVSFWDAPSLFWLNYSDRAFAIAAWLGVILSVVVISGVSEARGLALSAVTWGLLWGLYLSFVNVGQVFYGFGWETLLLETGFLAIFLGPARAEPPIIVIWALRWVLFRLMFGAGLIKIRGDSCWRDLSCMQYFYETQPMPNPLSWYFHQLPAPVLKFAVAFNHLVELGVPFSFFGPRKIRIAGAWLTIAFQGLLILGGNLSWLNYLAAVLAISCLDDSALRWLGGILPGAAAGITGGGGWPAGVIYALGAVIALLSIRPAMNLFSSRQLMNSSFDSLHLVNTYGAFGSVTRTRNEIVIEGTSGDGVWKEYEFKGKPGDVSRMPAQFAPYHLRLDWLMWFAAMATYREYPWLLNLAAKLLAGDQAILSLLARNPFPDKPPSKLRMTLYEYHFTEPHDPSGNSPRAWWVRTRVGGYLPELSLTDPTFLRALDQMGWAPE